MEHELDSLVTGSDTWAVPCEPESVIPWHDRSVLSDRQLSLESWWGQHQPQLHIDIEPWVMFHMDQSGLEFSKDTLTSALDALARQGSSRQRLLSAEALGVLKSTRDGFKRETQSYWGGGGG